MPGPPPKPTALRILEGNPSKRPLPVNEPKPMGIAERPAWLRPEGVAVWDELAPRLGRVGLLTPVDADQFGVFCTELAAYRLDPAGFMTSRLNSLRGMFTEFGMGPAARTRIQVKPSENTDDETRFFGAAG